MCSLYSCILLGLGSHAVASGSQHGVRCVPVNSFRCDLGQNFCLNWNQRCTGPFLMQTVAAPEL